ncbi:amino acid deaminase [Leucobacter chromiiresistens]
MIDALRSPDLDFVLGCARDDAAAGRLALWGASTLIDEHTGVASFDRQTFDALHEAAGVAAEFPVGNAGLIHVYGYWFSEVPTPFGFKRDRWQQGDLARALGRPADAFHLSRGADAEGPGSTPLQRVTDAALPHLRRPPQQARVGEADLRGSGADAARRSRVVLVQRGDRDASPALVYGIAPAGRAETTAPLQLITAFPFAGDADALLADFEAHPAPRWNAVVDW